MLQNDFSEMLENPTHDSGSHIDHLYVSSELKKLKIFSEQHSVYYSDHDIITLFVQKS